MKILHKNKRDIAFVSVLLVLICVIVFQHRENNSLAMQVDELSNQVMRDEQITIAFKNELAEKENDILKLKADFDSEKNRWNVQSADFQLQNKNFIDEQERMRTLIREALLDGSERTPIVDSSIPSDILSTILKLYDAMQKNDIKEFQRIDVDGVMTSSYEKRENIERVLWVRHDPENRANAIQNEFGLNSEVQLLVVHVLMKDSSIIDPNIALVKENGNWIVFRED